MSDCRQLDARLEPVRRDILEFQEQSTQSQKALSQDMGSMHIKIEDLSRATTALHSGLDRQSKGINLLVEYASRSSSTTPDLVDALQSYTREETNDNRSVKSMVCYRPSHERKHCILTVLSLLRVTQNPPSRLPRRPSEGLAGVKFVTA